MIPVVLAINPGSMSTRVGLFGEDNELASREISHPKTELSKYKTVAEQYDMRLAVVERALTEMLDETQGDASGLAAVAGRGGLLHPLAGGVYEVSDDMITELLEARNGEHPCNLGAPLAAAMARKYRVKAYIVDPVVVDELDERARLTGLPGITRRSLFHALSQRGAARAVAARLGMRYEETNLLVAHMGGGISMGAHRKGRVVEVVNALDGEGPMSPERTGALPIMPVLNALERGELDLARLKVTILRGGGLYAHLGTNDLREVEARIRAGDEHAAAVFEAMAYSIARFMASLAPALAGNSGKCDILAVVLTGGMARCESLTRELARLLSFLAPVEVVNGNEEMQILAQGVHRVLSGEETVREY